MRVPTVLIHGVTLDVEYVRDSVCEARGLEWHPTKLRVPPLNHRHCLVCWWVLHASDDPAVSGAYEAEGRWLCTECYTRFVQNNELGV
jgi:hypothetical protein